MKKNVILINSYANTERKIKTLKHQIARLKETKYPIILCSGCDNSKDIIDSVDYYFVNKEKILRSAVFNKKCSLQGKPAVAFLYLPINENTSYELYNDVIDPTISKNTKILFKLAEKLGFENAYYTEDDVIVSDFMFYVNHLNILYHLNKKFCVISGSDDMVYTSNYFANIKHFNETFCYPSSQEDFLNLNLIDKVKPWMVYEKCFANYLKEFEAKIHFISEKYFLSILLNEYSYSRWNSLNCLISNCTLIKRKTESINPFFYNCSGELICNLNIFINSNFLRNFSLLRKFHYICEDYQIQKNDIIKFELKDQDGNTCCKEVQYCSDDDILALEI